jgi:hypothetical protein
MMTRRGLFGLIAGALAARSLPTSGITTAATLPITTDAVNSSGAAYTHVEYGYSFTATDGVWDVKPIGAAEKGWHWRDYAK